MDAPNGQGYLPTVYHWVGKSRLLSDPQKALGETLGSNKVESPKFSEARENLAVGGLVMSQNEDLRSYVIRALG